MKRNDAIFAAVLALGSIGFFLAGRAPASNAENGFAGEPEVVAATFSSSWCSSCKILKPRLAKVIPDFEGEPIRFVEYDFTFGNNDQLYEQAAADGLAPHWNYYSKGTGFTLIVDTDTSEIIDILTINYSSEAMRAALSRALAVARADAGPQN